MRKLVDAVKLILLQDLHAENLIYARDPHNAVGDLAEDLQRRRGL